MRIEIWSDVVCPWCYIGTRRLETALARTGHTDDVEVVYRSFELDPTAPRNGDEPTVESLARKYGRDVATMRTMMEQVIDAAAGEGLDFRLFETVHTNTVDAHRLLHLALETGGPALQRELKEAMLAAYFTRAENIGDPAVLRGLATGSGLDSHRVDEVLAGQEYADAVATDVARARAYGATGVPFFVIDEKYGVSGAQPAEALVQVIERAWAESRPTLDMVGDEAGGEAGVCGPEGCAV